MTTTTFSKSFNAFKSFNAKRFCKSLNTLNTTEEFVSMEDLRKEKEAIESLVRSDYHAMSRWLLRFNQSTTDEERRIVIAIISDMQTGKGQCSDANDYTVSTADGDAIMTILCNWLFHNSTRFYLSHPASMGWLVGLQIASSSDHYQHFLNSILRQLTTTTATCIRTVFNCRPAHSYHSNWYCHRGNWSLSTNQLTTVDIGTDTDSDTICIQTGADAEGHVVSRCWLRKHCHILIARWFKLWASTTPTCSHGGGENFIDDERGVIKFQGTAQKMPVISNVL